jgi:hypothetical protein
LRVLSIHRINLKDLFESLQRKKKRIKEVQLKKEGPEKILEENKKRKSKTNLEFQLIFIVKNSHYLKMFSAIGLLFLLGFILHQLLFSNKYIKIREKTILY